MAHDLKLLLIEDFAGIVGLFPKKIGFHPFLATLGKENTKRMIFMQ